MRPVVRMMARWLLLRRIAGLGKTWRPPSPPPESFSTGKRGAVEFRDTVKPTVWGRRQGKKTPSAIDRVGNRVLDPELAKYRGWTKGRQGDKHEKKKSHQILCLSRAAAPAGRSWTRGKNHRGSVVKERTPGHGRGPLVDWSTSGGVALSRSAWAVSRWALVGTRSARNSAPANEAVADRCQPGPSQKPEATPLLWRVPDFWTAFCEGA